MMTPPQTEWGIEFYTDARGESPVVEFINDLPPQDRARVRNELRLLREFGVLLKMPHAKPVTGHKPLWELRPGDIRAHSTLPTQIVGLLSCTLFARKGKS